MWGEGKLHFLYDHIDQSTRLLIKKKITFLMIPKSEIVIHVEIFKTLLNKMVEMKHIIIDDDVVMQLFFGFLGFI
jgi:hypothetical protein